MPSVEERVARIERIIKKHRGEIDDLWERVNSDDNAHAEMEDETREIAERARRAVSRLEKRVKELEE